LDGALDGVCGSQAPAGVLGEFENGEALGDVALEPGSQALGLVAIAGDEAFEFLLGGLSGGGIPDSAQLCADTLSDGGAGCVVDSVLGEMELAALPERAGQDGLAGGAEAGVIVAGDRDNAAQAAGDQAVEEGAPVDFGFRGVGRDAEDAPLAVGVDTYGAEHGGVAHHATVALLFVTGVEKEVAECADAHRVRQHQSACRCRSW
jgi:hypothetical protein